MTEDPEPVAAPATGFVTEGRSGRRPELNPHTLDVLEFEKVRRMLLRWTFSIPGQEHVRALAPDLTPDAIRLSQERISEWKALELRGEAPGAAEIDDLRPLFLRLERGTGFLDAAELYRFLPFLDHLTRLRALWSSGEAPAAERATARPRLAEILARVPEVRAVRQRLERSISSGGEILDSASPALARARRELFERRQGATSLLDDLRARLGAEREESFVTLREGRYVLSVRSHQRSLLPGLLHGRSQSGQSVLVEPLEAVEANNRVAEAREEEKREEVRVLQELTEELRARGADLAAGFEAVGILDLIRAEARVALDLRAEAPQLNDKGRLRIVHGRHPILVEAEARGGAPVVPLDLEIDRGAPVLLVSGPNMGGKTVAMKTVGLIVLMARAGLHVPAADGTDLPVVDSVFVDLGDEQSIEGDLSTFAGHLRNIGAMWDEATPRSLAILDELGGGTDPEEGAALAMALLEGLAARGTLTLATTHLTAVKLFAADRPGMQNAAMEFDPRTQAPRFLLRIGEPGTSRAFDIARRLLPGTDLLDRAEQYRSPLLVQMEELFGRVEAERRRVEEERGRLEGERSRLTAAVEQKDRQAARLRDRLQRVRTERAAAAGKLYEDAARFVQELKLTLERKVNEASAQAAMEQVRGRERDLDRRVAELKAPHRRERPGRPLPPEEIHPGSEAWLSRLRARVRIERVAGARVWVDASGRRFEVARHDLEVVPEAAAKASDLPSRGGVNLPEVGEEPADRELDLRGCRAEEALARLDVFLDRARLHNLHQVRIVHGKGTGALKREVERHLRSHPLVTSFRMVELAEGSWGVTVANLGSSPD